MQHVCDNTLGVGLEIKDHLTLPQTTHTILLNKNLGNQNITFSLYTPMAQQPRRTVHRLASMRKHGTSAAALLLSPENCQSPTLCPITSNNSGDDATSIDKNAHLRTRTWNGSSRSSLEQLHRDLDAKGKLTDYH